MHLQSIKLSQFFFFKTTFNGARHTTIKIPRALKFQHSLLDELILSFNKGKKSLKSDRSH